MSTERTTRRITSTHHSDRLEAAESGSAASRRPSSQDRLMAKLAARKQEIETKRIAATAAATPPSGSEVIEGNAEASHGTTILRRQKIETLTKYPNHERAALEVLRKQGLPAVAEDCQGADEMLLTEDHMIVRFDYHPISPYDNRRHRYIVDVDMSYGTLVDHTITHLGPIAS